MLDLQEPNVTNFEYRAGELFCEDVSVTKLAEQCGTPLWVYSKAFLLGQLKQIQTAFAEVDPVICYSVKANSTLGILKVMRDAGSSFDVVSGGELYRVKAAGADTSKVVFAGVGKTDEEIRFALENKILMFDVESEQELDAIAAVAGSLGVVGPVALRLNPDIDAKTHAKTTTGKKGNKFGMDIERFRELAAKVLRDKRLALKGIHMHLGSPILTTDPYEAAGQKAIEVVEALRRDGHDINWINLGGGFGISEREGRREELRALRESSIDFYAAVRSAFLQTKSGAGRRQISQCPAFGRRTVLNVPEACAKPDGGADADFIHALAITASTGVARANMLPIAVQMIERVVIFKQGIGGIQFERRHADLAHVVCARRGDPFGDERMGEVSTILDP